MRGISKIAAIIAVAMFPSSAIAQEISPKTVAKYLVGTWGWRASKDDLTWFETRSRCGKVSGSTTQPVDEEIQKKINGIAFDKKTGGGTSIKGMLAFGQTGNDLAVISRFTNDVKDGISDTNIKPHFSIIETIKPTAKPNEFYIGKIPGMWSERTIRLITMDKMILLAAPEDKGGGWGSVPDREFRRCTNTDEVRSLKE